MTVAALDPRTAHARRQLEIETVDAWFEYGEACKQAAGARYEQVEPWAWTRLQTRLRAIRARRNALGRRTDTAEGSSPAGGPDTEAAR